MLIKIWLINLKNLYTHSILSKTGQTVYSQNIFIDFHDELCNYINSHTTINDIHQLIKKYIYIYILPWAMGMTLHANRKRKDKYLFVY